MSQILFGAHHKKLWNNIILSAMHSTLPSDAVPGVENRINGFTAGLGTVLFFEDQDTLDTLGKRQSMVVSLAPSWSDVASGMVQHTSKYTSCLSYIRSFNTYFSAIVSEIALLTW